MAQNWTLVTGASSGIGREIARIAASEGRPVILSARRGERLRRLAAELSETYGVEALALPADLSKPGGASALWAEAAKGRRVDVLVNNAGLGANGRFGAPEQRARELASIRVNVEAATMLAGLAADHMRGEGGGRILNVASLSAFMPGPGVAVYHASKAYLLSLSRAMRAELKGAGVSVTALCPGPVRTGFFRAAEMEEARILRFGLTVSAEAAARAGWRAAMRGNALSVPGVLPKLVALGARVTPVTVLTPVAAYLMGWGRDAP